MKLLYLKQKQETNPSKISLGLYVWTFICIYGRRSQYAITYTNRWVL